jgi:hypothetical protein
MLFLKGGCTQGFNTFGNIDVLSGIVSLMKFYKIKVFRSTINFAISLIGFFISFFSQ